MKSLTVCEFPLQITSISHSGLMSDGSPQRILTEAALTDFRSAIRRERNERWQYWELRLKVLGALLAGLTGAAGTLIGLIAIWKN